MTDIDKHRRLIAGGGLIALAGAGLASLSACGKESGKKQVGAVEDLMREHGVLRRALMVYTEAAARLRANPALVDAGALNQTAKLFRDFGEDYHEKKLEEAYIFPRIRKAGGQAARYVDTLLAQHQRGREVTEYILSATNGGHIASSNVAPLASAFDSFMIMYENHAAREDTIIFPAWKDALSSHELDELGETFEGIEKQQFGGDGFDQAVRQISDVEQALGIVDIGQFTAPPPPRPA